MTGREKTAEGVEMKEKCCVCKKYFDLGEMYEYRGMVACEEHFDKAQEMADFKRSEIIAENHRRTDRFKGLDLSDSAIGKANREILKGDIEIAKKQR